MNNDPIILSGDGRRRQQDILRAALGAALGRQRRYRLRKRTIECCCFAVVILLAMHLFDREVRVTRVAPNAGLTQATQPEPTIIVTRIETDPNILQRLSLPPIESTVRHIGDAELMRELADAHQAAGLITVDGKSRLVFP